MAFLFVGMDQAAVMPKNCAAYQGIVTHGIDSCTGLAMVSQGHVFLAHIGPPPRHAESIGDWYLFGRELIRSGMIKMSGSITNVTIVSPNREGLIKDDGPRLIQDRFEYFFKSSIDCKASRELGSKLKVKLDGEIKYGMGTYDGTNRAEQTYAGVVKSGDKALVLIS